MSMPQNPNGSPSDRDHGLHDVDLVAAYALDHDDVDRDAAARLVAACPECHAEFDRQREVTAWASAAPIVVLGDEERAALHARVDRAIAKPTVVALPDRSRRQPGQLLFRIGAAAAALAVVAGLGGVFGRLRGTNDGGTAFETAASEIAGGSAESTAAAGAPAPTTTTAAQFAAASAERTMLAGGDIVAVKREIEDLIVQVTSPEVAGANDTSQADAMTSVPECSDQIVDQEVLLTAESLLDGEPIVVFIVSGGDAPGADEVEALVFRIADCSSVDLG
jgi:hypothetical protein